MKQPASKNLDLFIFEQLKAGLNPSKISQQFNLSKQRISYHLSSLKERGLIKKIGYGTYEILGEYSKEVKKKITRIAQTTRLEQIELDSLSRPFYEKLLRRLNLNKCLVCGFKDYELHHLTPRSKNGLDLATNLIPLCPNHHAEIHKKGINIELQGKIDNFFFTLKNQELFKPDSVRAHAFQFTLRINPELRNWDKREEILKKLKIKFKPLNIFGGAQSITFKGRKVWLTRKSIIVFEKSSYMAETSTEARKYAVYDFFAFVGALERYLKADFGVSKKNPQFKVSRQHYALIKNALAKQCDRDGQKLEVSNERGQWFIIDNSFNLHEAETIHPETAEQDNIKVQNFFNGIKKFEGFTPEFVVNSLGGVMKTQEMFAQNIESHVSAIQELAIGVRELREEVKKINKPKDI